MLEATSGGETKAAHAVSLANLTPRRHARHLSRLESKLASVQSSRNSQLAMFDSNAVKIAQALRNPAYVKTSLSGGGVDLFVAEHLLVSCE